MRAGATTEASEPGTRIPTAPGAGATYVQLSFMAFFWAGAFVAGRLAVRELTPEYLAALRFLLACAFLVPLMIVREGKQAALSWRLVPALLFLGFTGIFLYNVLLFHGLETVPAIDSSLIVAINPALTYLAAAVLLGEPFGLRHLAGILLSLIGVGTVITGGRWEALLTFRPAAGHLFLFGAVLAWVAYSLAGKRVMHSLSPLTSTTYACLMGTALLVPFALLRGPVPGLGSLSTTTWLAVIWLALLASGVGFVFYYTGIRRLGAGQAAMFINSVPVLVFVQSVLFFREDFTLVHAVGAVLVLGGIALTSRPERPVFQALKNPTGDR